ncbi:hypothetical protein DRE_04245 [Drechslerella stenobrocha 248]|uniref:Ornithine decarboxylase antizyme n=1 Tax=Drechslerella stenobrocha 248 TaxID=1043628 RepID=W7I2E5_9PEZI|nr:hypothetical protein DRE_04245 [Drechslerella stenobrocha 248]
MSNLSSNTSSNNHHLMYDLDTAATETRSPVLASCFSTDVSATVVRSFHYSSTRAGGVEVPNSPTTNSRRQTSPSRQGRWAARTIIAECERLCDGVMRQVFFGYGRKPAQTPAMDVSLNTSEGGNGNNITKSSDLQQQHEGEPRTSTTTPSTKAPVRRLVRRSSELQTRVAAYLEVFDYIGGSAFRGFVSEKGPLNKPERSLFLFFDKGVNGTELKSGLVALIDLATECFDCQDLVICLDRETDGLDSLAHNLGWVGLELITLKNWASQELRDRVFTAHKLDKEYFTSDKWLFLGMEL